MGRKELYAGKDRATGRPNAKNDQNGTTKIALWISPVCYYFLLSLGSRSQVMSINNNNNEDDVTFRFTALTRHVLKFLKVSVECSTPEHALIRR